MSKTTRQAKTRRTTAYTGKPRGVRGFKLVPHKHQYSRRFVNGSMERWGCATCPHVERHWWRIEENGVRVVAGLAQTPRTRPETPDRVALHPLKLAVRQKLRQAAIQAAIEHTRESGHPWAPSTFYKQWVANLNSTGWSPLKVADEWGNPTTIRIIDQLRLRDVSVDVHGNVGTGFEVVKSHEEPMVNLLLVEGGGPKDTDPAWEFPEQTDRERAAEDAFDPHEFSDEDAAELDRANQMNVSGDWSGAIRVLMDVYARRPEYRDEILATLGGRGFHKEALATYVQDNWPDQKVNTKTTKSALVAIIAEKCTSDAG